MRSIRAGCAPSSRLPTSSTWPPRRSGSPGSCSSRRRQPACQAAGSPGSHSAPSRCSGSPRIPRAIAAFPSFGDLVAHRVRAGADRQDRPPRRPSSPVAWANRARLARRSALGARAGGAGRHRRGRCGAHRPASAGAGLGGAPPVAARRSSRRRRRATRSSSAARTTTSPSASPPRRAAADVAVRVTALGPDGLGLERLRRAASNGVGTHAVRGGLLRGDHPAPAPRRGGSRSRWPGVGRTAGDRSASRCPRAGRRPARPRSSPALPASTAACARSSSTSGWPRARGTRS